MIKPGKLKKGDIIATISPSWGCAGDSDVRWQYDLGVSRLEDLGFTVLAAPNSLRGEAYLQANPKARADDVMWAFDHPKVKGVIANIGGNDAERILPFISPDVIKRNPKVLCGYSDVMSLHLYCNQLGLITFYGDNLLTTIAEAEFWHPYSKEWFQRVLMDGTVIGDISPSEDWSPDANNHTDRDYKKRYGKNSGYQRIQGCGTVCGELFGGHGGIMEYTRDSPIQINQKNFEHKILFFEDVPEVFDLDYIEAYFEWLARNGYLQVLSGIIIGKMQSHASFEPYANKIREIVSHKYGLMQLPIMYGVNFGHSNPITVLPYGVRAKLDMDHLKFSILESGVLD